MNLHKEMLADECLFIQPYHRYLVAIAAHVDDLSIIAPDEGAITDMKQHLANTCELNEQGRKEFSYLGLSQPDHQSTRAHCLESLFSSKDFNKCTVTKSKPFVRVQLQWILVLIDGDKTKHLSDIMEIMYLAWFTRPEILFAKIRTKKIIASS